MRVMSAVFVALFIDATTSVAEVILRTQKSFHQRLVGNIRLFASALATILLLVTSLIVSCIVSVLWTCLLVKLGHESCQDLCLLLSQTTDEVPDMLKKLIGSRDDNEIIFMGWAIILILSSFEWASSVLQTKKKTSENIKETISSRAWISS
ncbi:hypothetical protein NC653_032597 [Populus alba x Populus x berolinensis]|uniref:Transmembrane protein n=1 Tax=Populus alba x Populus x berolinensis TaxID=444605 RepID=A0AAD6LRQ9_9ROSI|nr:hypothetical protein NC653_032597 [Populus alba x Populus x berolinensis]